MKGKTTLYLSLLFSILVSLFALGYAAGAPLIPDQSSSADLSDIVPPSDLVADSPQAPLEDPYRLITSKVKYYDLAAPKLFWYQGPEACPPPLNAVTASTYEAISRIATHGGLVRELYLETFDPCLQDPDFDSNIVADQNYVYWVSNSLGGLARLSTDANVGDAPELLSSAVSGYSEIAQDDDYIYVLSKTGLGLWRIRKSDGDPFKRVTDPGPSPRAVAADGKYVYWVDGGALKRIIRAGLQAFIVTIEPSGVDGYYPEGRTGFCIIGDDCFYTEYVFIGKGNQIIRYDNLDPASKTTIYTSSYPGESYVYNLVTENSFHSKLFIFESRTIDCDIFCTYQSWLMRMGKDGSTPEQIYASPEQAYLPQASDALHTYDDHLFWKEEGLRQGLMRLPTGAAVLPLTNMSITAMEITQGIQNLDNDVRLIQDRRTFVLLHAKSDVYGEQVQGVTAYLYKTDSSGDILDGPLLPVNPPGTYLTVHYTPNRFSLWGSNFLFELPWDWTTGTVYLMGVLNPTKYPPQASYANNEWSSGPLTFQPSPRLAVQFVSFGYDLDGTVYYPRLVDDVFMTYSWIRRVYPLASTPGHMSDPTPGFRPNLWVIYDEGLGSRVVQTAYECLTRTDRDFCATAYMNLRMYAMRFENNIPWNVFMYGMLSEASGLFQRGQAASKWGVSSGPVGLPIPGRFSWDQDITYADWMAGHEIGHTLGRDHPVPGSNDPATKDIREGCGHSPDDPNYPYVDARIGPISGEFAGFDVGDPALNMPVRVYTPIWHDVMSYCSDLWISDYNYNAMYDYMMAHPSTSQPPPSTHGVLVSGDFLSVFGVIDPASNTASIYHLSHLSKVYEVPPLVAGDYIIRLLDSGGATLADYSFTAEEILDGYGTLGFGHIVDFVAGTATVQIIDGDTDQELTSQAVSANPPVISNVALQGATEPLTGTVTLGWIASDPDGGGLTFDIFYSTDGVDFQPIQMGVDGSSAQVDTTTLGGTSAGILRVVASDGVNTTQGDTDPFSLAAKPPMPRILTPEDGVQIHWGQLLNFAGEAFDYQDGSVAAANLVWKDGDGATLGTGELLSITDLPVGTNQVTLTATNSDGLSASTTITIIVDDDLSWPGPGLAVHPTQVGWHVGEGTTQIQTMDVNIINYGSGSLAWEASETASWLTLDAVDGTTPPTITLTLTADPSGMKTGATQTTILTISAPSTEESVEVIVSLSVGDLWDAYGSQPFKVLLPLILH